MFKRLLIVSFFPLMLFSQAAMAADAITMLTNITDQIPEFTKLVTGAFYLMGMALTFKALYHLKVYGEARTMMSVQSSLRTPLTYLFVGTGMIYSPSFIQSANATLFGADSFLAYEEWTGYTNYGGTMMNSVFYVVQFIGLVSFFRGWVLMTHTAGQSAQPGAFGKAMTHIIGGILCMNIVLFANILQNTLGVSFT